MYFFIGFLVYLAIAFTYGKYNCTYKITFYSDNKGRSFRDKKRMKFSKGRLAIGDIEYNTFGWYNMKILHQSEFEIKFGVNSFSKNGQEYADDYIEILVTFHGKNSSLFIKERLLGLEKITMPSHYKMDLMGREQEEARNLELKVKLEAQAKSEEEAKKLQQIELESKLTRSITDKLIADSKTTTIMQNFIKSYCNDTFYEIRFGGAEAVVEYLPYYIKKYFDIEDRRDMLFINYKPGQKDINWQRNFLVNFSNLVDLISSKNGIKDKKLCAITTWNVLYMNAIKHYSDSWVEQFGFYFENIQTITFEDAVRKYCRLQVIEHNSFKALGYFTYYLMDKRILSSSIINEGFYSCRKEVTRVVQEMLKTIRQEVFEQRLTKESIAATIQYSIHDTDMMNGTEFENFIGLLFTKMGYKASVTKTSGDQGIDVIAERNGIKFGIQAKCYSNVVGNSAIQEVVAGMAYYKCDKGLVVTNNTFTKSAVELAEANNITLWNRSILKQKIEEVFI